MLPKTPFSTLCLLSLAVPLVGHSSNFWLFSGSSNTTSKCEEKCESKCPEPKPCCETRTVTEVITVCEDPCHPSHCRWDIATSVGIGYRHDRISQRYTPQSDTLNRVKFRYRDIDSVMALVRFDARYSNFLFNLEADYSPTVNATMSAPFNVSTLVGETFDFRVKKMTGYEADAMASVGYRLQFMNGNWSRAAIIFQVGYRYSHQTYETDKQDKVENVSFISILEDQAPMHAEWFGPFLEARFSFVYRDRLYFQPFYQYHFLDYRAQRKEAQKLYSFLGGSPPVPFDFIVKFLTEGDNARGQLGGIDLFYQPKTEHYRLGLKGTYLSFESRETTTRTKIKQVFLATTPSTSITSHPRFFSHSDWQSYSIAAYAGYNF